MSKIRSILMTFATFLMLLCSCLALTTTNRVHAGANDLQAIDQVSASIDTLWTTFDSPEIYTEAFYQTFARQAKETGQEMAAARAKLAQPGQAGAVAEAAAQVNDSIAGLQAELTNWRTAALAYDQAAFDEGNEKFNSAIDRYNAAIDRYNSAIGATPESLAANRWLFRIVLAIVTIVSTLAFAWAYFLKPKVNKRPRVLRARELVALNSLWPLAGGVINYYLYFYTEVAVYYELLGLVSLGFAPFIWAIWAYRKAARQHGSEKSKIKYGNSTIFMPPRKFFILSVVTFGIYPMYWGWKAWEIVGQAEGKKYRSAVRGFFFVVTSFSLFAKILSLAKGQGYRRSYPPTLMAACLLILFISTYVPYDRWVDPDLSLALILVAFLIGVAMPLPAVAAGNFYIDKVAEKVKPLKRNTPFIVLLCVYLVLASVAGALIYFPK